MEMQFVMDLPKVLFVKFVKFAQSVVKFFSETHLR